VKNGKYVKVEFKDGKTQTVYGNWSFESTTTTTTTSK